MAENTGTADTDNADGAIEILFFKSDSCPFCPRAEEVIREVIGEFDPGVFRLVVINVSEKPEVAEEYGVFALPTVVVGGMSVTGVPEPEMLVKIILGSRLSRKRRTTR